MNAAQKGLPSARILDCTPDEYHRDPCDTPSLSSSTANVMVSESPLHAWTRHPKFGQTEGDEESLTAEDDSTKAKDEGTVIHKLLLGKGTDLVVVDADSFRTKYARELRDEARSAGKLPVLACKLDTMQEAANHLREKCRTFGFEFAGGEAEMAIEWYERGTAGPVVCRSMLDYVFPSDGVIVDVKKIRSANPKQIARYFVDHGYDIQEHAYSKAFEQLRPKFKGRSDFVFLFMEIEPPYAVVPVRPDMALRECGKQRWGRAVSLWETCLARNEWPSYCGSTITLEAPNWVIREHLGTEWAT